MVLHGVPFKGGASSRHDSFAARKKGPESRKNETKLCPPRCCPLKHYTIRGFAQGWFRKGWCWRMFPCTKNRNEGTFGCFPSTKNRNEGTFGCSPVPHTRTRLHLDVPRYQRPERGYICQIHPCSKPPFCFAKRRTCYKPQNPKNLKSVRGRPKVVFLDIRKVGQNLGQM